MGHRDNVWMSERFQQMLAGAIAWATGAEDAEVDADLFKVAPEAGVIPSEVAAPEIKMIVTWSRKALRR
jgi:hypothetical protein